MNLPTAPAPKDESDPSAFRVIRVRKTAPRSDGKLNPNAYAIDVKVREKQYYSYVKRRGRKITIPESLLRHPLKEVVAAAVALEFEKYLSTQL